MNGSTRSCAARWLAVALGVLAIASPGVASADQETAVAAAVEDVPNYFGQPGLLNLTSAEPSHQGRIALAVRFGGFSQSNFLDTGASETLLLGRLAFDYSFFSWLDAGIMLLLGSNDSATQVPTTSSFGTDAFPRVRAAWQVGDFAFGAVAGARLLGGIQTVSFDFKATGADARALFSYAPSALGEHRPLRIHLNAGYTLDNSSKLYPDSAALDPVYRFFNSISQRNWAFVGLGAEYQTQLLTPFVEYSADNPLGEGLSPWTSPSRVALGLRSSPLPGLILELSGDVGTSGVKVADYSAEAPWSIVAGLGYTFAPFTRVVEKTVAGATISGMVVDTATSHGLAGAQVALGGSDASAVVTGPDGRFRILDAPKGTSTLTASKDGYTDASAPVTVPQSEGDLVVLTATPLPPQGQLEGTVVDLDEKPLAAAVHIAPSQGGPGQDLTIKGSFAVTVPAGEYQITATAQGYLAAGRHAVVDNKSRVVEEIVLRPATDAVVATLQVNRIAISDHINFATGSADLLPDAKPILDQVVDILVRHPEVKKLRVEGHTDDTGGSDFNLKLSVDRANSVKAYLVQHGIDGSRLSAEGWGDTRPLKPGTDAATRAANRRVEFLITPE